jgi:hypothetical protein
MPPELATACRQAAALFLHWRRGRVEGCSDLAGELAILDEISDNRAAWTAVICALLEVGCNMAEAAEDGSAESYLQHVVREASLDEVTADA